MSWYLQKNLKPCCVPAFLVPVHPPRAISLVLSSIFRKCPSLPMVQCWHGRAAARRMGLWSLGPINQNKEDEYKWNMEEVLNPSPFNCPETLDALPVKGPRAAGEKEWQKTQRNTPWAKEWSVTGEETPALRGTNRNGFPSNFLFPSICICTFTRSVGLAKNCPMAPADTPPTTAFLPNGEKLCSRIHWKSSQVTVLKLKSSAAQPRWNKC